MMDVPIRLHGKLVGVICHEHIGSPRQWSLEEQDFAGSVADLIMLKLERLERQKAQIALRESERRYRTLLKNIPQMIFYKDLNSVYLLCNESYAEDLGLALPDDIREHHFQENTAGWQSEMADLATYLEGQSAA